MANTTDNTSLTARLGLHSPLARRLVVSLVLVSSLLALLITLIQLYADYRHDTDTIRDELRLIEQSFGDSLRGSVWTLDDAQINAQLKGILAMPHIVSATINVDGKPHWRQGVPDTPTRGQLSHRFDLVTHYKGRERHIGTVIITASLTEVYRHLMDKAVFILLSNALKTLVVVVVIFLIFQLTITRRLNSLAQYANALQLHEGSATPPLIRPTDNPQADEIDQLGKALQTMQQRLTKAYQQQAQLNDELREESTQLQAANRELASWRERLEEEVRQRTQALEASNQELESFAYSVSHDLRAPLRGVSGFAQVLLEDYADGLDDEGREYLQRVHDSALHMGELIEDLLKLSRITQAQLHCQDIDLSAIAREVCERLQQAHPERQVRLNIQPDITVWGDPGLLQVALDNLLGNAWKYSAQQEVAEITFACRQEDEQRICFVRDNGAGFDMRYSHKLFTPFQRLHASDTFQGDGIGLATVSRVILRHGGRIWAESEPGQGATFFFSLPDAPADTDISPDTES